MLIAQSPFSGITLYYYSIIAANHYYAIKRASFGKNQYLN